MTDAGEWGALEEALAWRLSKLGWAQGLGPPPSPLYSGMWSSQNLEGRPWQELWVLLCESHTQLHSHTRHLCVHGQG